MFRVTRLPNGLAVVSATMPQMASVCVGLWVGVGGRHEPAELNGVSHFIEHMLFKGTRQRSSRAISEAVEGVGGYLNAFTTEEDTCFYAKAGGDRLDHLIEVLMDMFLHSIFDPREIEKEREVIKEEQEMYRDDPRQHIQDLLSETLWLDHPLGRNLTGSKRTINAMTRRQMLDYKQAHYAARAVIVAAAGRVRHEQLVQSVTRHSRAFSGGNPCGYLPAIQEQKAPRIRLCQKDTEQMQMALGFRTCSRHDERRFALRLLNAIMGENMSSRLFQTLREDRGLAYAVHSSLSFFDDTGALEIYAGLDTERLPQVLKLIARELRRLAEAPVPAGEVRRACDYLVGQMDLSLEGSENMMMWAGEQFLAYGKVTQPLDVKRRLKEVTPAEIRRVAQESIRADRMSLAIVGGLKSVRGLAECLKL